MLIISSIMRFRRGGGGGGEHSEGFGPFESYILHPCQGFAGIPKGSLFSILLLLLLIIVFIMMIMNI